MPSRPFSLCKVTRTPGARWLATRVGMPMPRLTYSPSRSSPAAMAAISSRVQGTVHLRVGAPHRTLEQRAPGSRTRGRGVVADRPPLDDLLPWRGLDQALDVDPGSHHRVRRQEAA